MDNCIFCKIARKEIPGRIVYEDDVCLAFLDLSQVTDGHTLVIPKKHYQSFLEVDDDVLEHMIKVTKKLANEIVKKTGASGCNILSNAGEVAGQSVPHFHIHIIPRYSEQDGLTLRFKDRSKEADLDAIYDKITK